MRAPKSKKHKGGQSVRIENVESVQQQADASVTNAPTAKRILREICVKIHGEEPYTRTLLIQPFGGSQDPSVDQENNESEKPGGRELSISVCGIPCRWSLAAILELFSRYGDVESASYGAIVKGKNQIVSGDEYSQMYAPRYVKVTFQNIEGYKKVLKAGVPAGSLKRPKPIPEPSSCRTHPETFHPTQTKGSQDAKSKKKNDSNPQNEGNDSSEELHGLQRFLSNYYKIRPSASVIQKNIDEYMQAYDIEEERRRKEMEEKALEDDGWTLVGRKRKGVTGVSNNFISVEKAKSLKEKKKEEKLQFDFYRFQRREIKRNEIIKLQQQFEEDRKKIARLKSARKFRPF